MADLVPPAVAHDRYQRLLEAAQLVVGETHAALEALRNDDGPDVAAAIEALELAQEIFADWRDGQQIDLSAASAPNTVSDGMLDVSKQEIEEWFGMAVVERYTSVLPWYVEYQLKLMNRVGDMFLTKCAVKNSGEGSDVRALFKAWGQQFASEKQGLFSFGQPPREPVWYSTEIVPPGPDVPFAE